MNRIKQDWKEIKDAQVEFIVSFLGCSKNNNPENIQNKDVRVKKRKTSSDLESNFGSLVISTDKSKDNHKNPMLKESKMYETYCHKGELLKSK